MRVFVALIFFISSITVFGQTEQLEKRLNTISRQIPLSYHPSVVAEVQSLLKNRDKTAIIIGKSNAWLPAVKDAFAAHNLPVELAYLAPALSQYNIEKVSEDGGSGYWQMRYLVGKRHGLNLTSYIDERRDFSLATEAFIPHIKELYKVFGDWHSAIAAYVAGEVEVQKAMRKADTLESYWDYYELLPARYRNAVSQFIAYTYLHNFYKEHSIAPKKYTETPTTAVFVNQWVTLYQINTALQTDYQMLKFANAIYKKQVIPNAAQDMKVLIPSDKVNLFNELGDSIYRVQSHADANAENQPKPPVVNQPRMVEPSGTTTTTTTPPSSSTTSTSNETKVLYYTVRSGDYLGRIADLYDVGVSDVRRWNNLSGDRINANQRLKIYKSANVYDRYAGINRMSSAEQNRLLRKD